MERASGASRSPSPSGWWAGGCTAGQRTYIPLKVNQAGVIPIIFASSLLYIPVLLANVVPWTGFRTFVNNHIHADRAWSTCSSYGLLIIVFTFFYVHVAFDPHQQADIIRKQGGYIPGIRPGPPTERYLARDPEPHHPARGAVPGRRGPGPVACCWPLWHITGYPVLRHDAAIAVGVALETMRQIDSQLMMRNYEGFLK